MHVRTCELGEVFKVLDDGDSVPGQVELPEVGQPSQVRDLREPILLQVQKLQVRGGI